MSTSVAEGAGKHMQHTYVKAVPLKERTDIKKIMEELKIGNILIVKITPLAMKNIDEVKSAIEELKTYVETAEGDIARLGEERIVVTPAPFKIWRKKLGEQT